MNRDPIYAKIVEKLAGPLDGDLFEHCAVALIGKTNPNLAPTQGGDDAGLDGAFGSPDGPYPLVCTVRRDVIGNVRKNISAYLAKRHGPKLAAIATSQLLSNRKKRNLENEARKLGVTITNIYDAPYFADQLYRDSKWRKELLGITGDPPALSALPRVGRFVQPELLVGRDQELQWLRQFNGDALVIGHPGSGKTYLHQHLAEEGLCLFAVDDSLERLANAIRDQQPSIVVVDDAHIYPDLVERLHRLRAELGADFYIHLNCWPRQEAAVRRILNLPDSSVCRLLPLRKPEIFKLIQEMGIDGPDWLQHFLISQADGKPGLAVALAERCKSQDVASIWSGEATAQQLLGNLRLVRHDRERCVLAAFAVGGDWGMSFTQVSQATGIPKVDLRDITAGLASGGLIEEVDEQRLQVRPPAIRPVLVRDVFYGGPTSLSIDPLLQDVRSPGSTASVLLSARQRGADVTPALLERFVLAANTTDVWEHFAWVDAHSAQTIFDKYPDQVCNAAPGLLHWSPAAALNALLDADDANMVSGAGAIEHPRRRISEWLFPFDADPDLTIERRLTLLGVLETRAQKGKAGQGAAFTWALAELLQATFNTAQTSPGDVHQINCIRGVASQAILEKIAALWPRIRALLPHMPDTAARILFDQLENWCLPQRLTLVAKVSAETLETVRRNGRTMLSDVLSMPQCNRAWRTRAADMSKWGCLDLPIEVDPLFDALYADRDRQKNWQEQFDKRISTLQTHADDLIQRGMDDVLRFLEAIRTEAVEFGQHNSAGFLWVVYQRIANTCDQPSQWLDSLIAKGAPPNFLLPFLDRLSTGPVDQYVAAIERLLGSPNYRSIAITRAIRFPVPNEGLLEKTLAVLNEPDLEDHLWMRDPDIPLTVMGKMLTHSNPSVRAAAAVGEWQRDPPGNVRPELEQEWRLAVRDVQPNHYALNDIFEKNASIAFDWLENQIHSGRLYLSIQDQALHSASSLLTGEQRAHLLRLFTRHNYDDEVFDLIIGSETDLFAGWLSFQTDHHLRLLPLRRQVGPRWEQMALLALDAGVTPDELAENCLPIHYGGFGPLSHHFLRAIPAYEALASHPDPRLRQAGKRGLSIMQSNAQQALERERREETYGS